MRTPTVCKLANSVLMNRVITVNSPLSRMLSDEETRASNRIGAALGELCFVVAQVVFHTLWLVFNFRNQHPSKSDHYLTHPDSLDINQWCLFALGFDNGVGALSPTVLENGKYLLY